MKSVIKRSLFVGMSMALVALTALRFKQESQIEGSAAPPPIDPTDPPSRLERKPVQAISASPIAPPTSPIPVVAPTVTFRGRVVRNGPRFALRETAGVLYPLDAAGIVLPFEGEHVRVTGKLDLDTRLLYVDAIEAAVA